MARFAPIIIILLALSACASAPGGQPMAVASVSIDTDQPLPSDWKETALPEDVARIIELSAKWSHMFAVAQPRFGKSLASEGALLDPAAALDRPEPSPGRYRCRVVRIGFDTKSKRGPTYIRFKPFYCFVSSEGSALAFSKATGTHRPGGWLWPDGPRRMIFLGGIAERAGDPAPAYRAGSSANIVGILERIGDFRWRLAVPSGSSPASLDVMELVPDTPPPTETAQ